MFFSKILNNYSLKINSIFLTYKYKHQKQYYIIIHFIRYFYICAGDKNRHIIKYWFIHYKYINRLFTFLIHRIITTKIKKKKKTYAVLQSL